VFFSFLMLKHLVVALMPRVVRVVRWHYKYFILYICLLYTI
jgi:hypothetical protein